MSGRFAFDGGSRRMVITNRDDENDDHEFHCGDCFQLEIDGKWHSVRIEHGSGCGWYLIGLPKYFKNCAHSFVGSRAKL